MPLKAGTSIDRYTLVAPLGEGGQGEVWLASDPLDGGGSRALKLIELRLARGTELERVRQEARLLAKLRHPSLCRCYGLFEDLNHGVLGFAMDYADGKPLTDVLDDTRLTRSLREHVILHVARALAHVHAAGAVHRDVKPSNVVVEDRFFQDPEDPSHVKLVDFGVAALDGVWRRLTAIGHAVGTPPYMAPEQLDPTYWGADNAGPQADLFAFGILCWRLFIGGHPTRLDAEDGVGAYLMAYRKADQDGTWPPRIAAKGAVRVTRRCLSLRPEDRFTDAEQLVARLEEAMVRPSLEGLHVTGEHAIPRQEPSATTLDHETEHALTLLAETPSPTQTEDDSKTVMMRPSFPPARPSGAPDSPVRDTQPSAPPPEALRTAALAPDLSRQMKTQPGLRATLKMDGAPFESRPTRDTSEPPASVMRASWTRRALFTLSVAVACGAAAYVTTLWVKGRFESETDVEEDESLVVSVDAPPPATSTVLVVDKDRDTDPAVGVSCNACPTHQSCGGDCAATIGASEEFSLRLLQVVHSPQGNSGPVATLKGVRVSVCTSHCRDITDGSADLRVTGAELADGIDITITDATGVVLYWKNAATQEPIRRTALCKGFDFRFDHLSTRTYRTLPVTSRSRGQLRWIAFYLDPPGQLPVRCSGAWARLP